MSMPNDPSSAEGEATQLCRWAFEGNLAKIKEVTQDFASDWIERVVDEGGATVVHWASAGNKVDVLSHLFVGDDKESLNREAGAFKARPIHWAAK